MDRARLKIVMACFDKLPEELRDWLNYYEKRLDSDYILRGEGSVRRLKRAIEAGCRLIFKPKKGEN